MKSKAQCFPIDTRPGRACNPRACIDAATLAQRVAAILPYQQKSIHMHLNSIYPVFGNLFSNIGCFLILTEYSHWYLRLSLSVFNLVFFCSHLHG